MPRTTLFRYPDDNISHWKTTAMLAAYLIYTAWMAAYTAFAYAAIRRPATTNARYIDYFALAFFGMTLLLFGWLFIVQGITPSWRPPTVRVRLPIPKKF